MKFSVIQKLFMFSVLFIERKISDFFPVKQTLILTLISSMILVTVMMPEMTNAISPLAGKVGNPKNVQTTVGGKPTAGRKVRQVYVQGNFRCRKK